MKIIQKTAFVCSSCGQEFKDKQSCLGHEIRWHKCTCCEHGYTLRSDGEFRCDCLPRGAMSLDDVIRRFPNCDMFVPKNRRSQRPIEFSTKQSKPCRAPAKTTKHHTFFPITREGSLDNIPSGEPGDEYYFVDRKNRPPKTGEAH